MQQSSVDDPLRLPKLELRNRVVDTIVASGELAKLTVKNSASQPLQTAITSFVSEEKTILNTEGMLKKINEGMIDLEDGLNEVIAAIGARTPEPQYQVGRREDEAEDESRNAIFGDIDVLPAQQVCTLPADIEQIKRGRT